MELWNLFFNIYSSDKNVEQLAFARKGLSIMRFIQSNSWNYCQLFVLPGLLQQWFLIIFQMIQQCCQKVTTSGVLKTCSKFTGEHPCQNAISIKLQSNFTEIKLRHGFSPVNFLHIFRASFLKNTSERLLLNVAAQGMIKPVVVPRK